jgi:hypothetical protein
MLHNRATRRTPLSETCVLRLSAITRRCMKLPRSKFAVPGEGPLWVRRISRAALGAPDLAWHPPGSCPINQVCANLFRSTIDKPRGTLCPNLMSKPAANAGRGFARAAASGRLRAGRTPDRLRGFLVERDGFEPEISLAVLL